MSASIVVASATRTPVGSFNGAFANTPARMSSARSPSRKRLSAPASTARKWTR